MRQSVIIAAALLLAGSAAAGVFTPELLGGYTQNQTRFTDIAVDAGGEPHVAWSGAGEIRYQWRSGGAWTTASRPVGPDNLYCAMALDANGAAHFAIRASTAPDFFLMYLSYENGFWTTAYPDLPDIAAGDTLSGDWPDIAVDADGNPFISYRWQDDTGAMNGELRVASRAGGVWSVETVDAGPDDVGLYSSIALNTAGRPRVAYYDCSNGDLKLARKNPAGTWVVEVVDDAPDVGAWTDIAVGADDVPHISYIDVLDDAVRYATRSGGVWTVEAVPEAVTDAREGTSIAVDAAGDPHIVFFNVNAAKLRHVVKSGGVWSNELVDTTPDRGWRPALALAGDGTPHVAYLEGASQDVYYAGSSDETAVPHASAPAALQLRVFPNPAPRGAPVRIVAEGDKSSGTVPAEIGVFDLAGRRVRTLPAAGPVAWDGRTDRGAPAPQGSYVVRYRQGDRTATSRILLLD